LRGYYSSLCHVTPEILVPNKTAGNLLSNNTLAVFVDQLVWEQQRLCSLQLNLMAGYNNNMDQQFCDPPVFVSLSLVGTRARIMMEAELADMDNQRGESVENAKIPSCGHVNAHAYASACTFAHLERAHFSCKMGV